MSKKKTILQIELEGKIERTEAMIDKVKENAQSTIDKLEKEIGKLKSVLRHEIKDNEE